ncbi:hypothetical protein NDU88_007155 [Pleurodeles waltl]|uniref:Uncharacterized protein n=1 Tax=Pleurodeles waltl TaxID=8319 RepID=A0AAV7PTA0_PLEWA|nr:hypothetical protein NDU88_007155 [Pleurodeles waltl]
MSGELPDEVIELDYEKEQEDDLDESHIPHWCEKEVKDVKYIGLKEVHRGSWALRKPEKLHGLQGDPHAAVQEGRCPDIQKQTPAWCQIATR